MMSRAQSAMGFSLRKKLSLCRAQSAMEFAGSAPRRHRGQSAMEFLLTYGWAIIIMVVVIGTLFYLGVLNPYATAPNKLGMPAGFVAHDFRLEEGGAFVLDLGQGTSKPIIVTGVYCTQESTVPSNPNNVPNVRIEPSEHKLIAHGNVICRNTEGNPYTGPHYDGQVYVWYEEPETGMSHMVQGELAYTPETEVGDVPTIPPATNTPVPTVTPTSVPTNTPTSVPTVTPTPVPTNTPTPGPTPTNTPPPADVCTGCETCPDGTCEYCNVECVVADCGEEGCGCSDSGDECGTGNCVCTGEDATSGSCIGYRTLPYGSACDCYEVCSAYDNSWCITGTCGCQYCRLHDDCGPHGAYSGGYCIRATHDDMECGTSCDDYFCGDGYCNEQESTTSCSADCPSSNSDQLDCPGGADSCTEFIHTVSATGITVNNVYFDVAIEDGPRTSCYGLGVRVNCSSTGTNPEDFTLGCSAQWRSTDGAHYNESFSCGYSGVKYIKVMKHEGHSSACDFSYSGIRWN